MHRTPDVKINCLYNDAFSPSRTNDEVLVEVRNTTTGLNRNIMMTPNAARLFAAALIQQADAVDRYNRVK